MLNFRHVKWVEFLQECTFVVKHKTGIENKATDALSQKMALLHSMRIKVTGFERLKEAYASYPNFRETYITLVSDSSVLVLDYILQDNHFKGTILCIPRTSVRYFLVWELHVGGLAGHFG